MEGSVDQTLDEGRVARGGSDTELADSWRGNTDGFFVFLQTIHEDDVGSLGGIIRQRFLFLWADINNSSIGEVLWGDSARLVPPSGTVVCMSGPTPKGPLISSTTKE